MTFRSARLDQKGLSLIEMMVSLLVFALMTVGVVPLMASSLRGSSTARSYTVGKNIAQEAMERIRGLPYFISYGTQARKVDVLDLYFPCATSATCGPTGTTYDATAGVYEFTTTCNASTTANPACPKDIPPEYDVSFIAKFVAPGTADSDGRETYAVSAPLAGYRWDVSPTDIPASRMIELIITAEWEIYGETKNYTLNTLVTDRKVAEERIRGTARVAYAIQVLAGYRNLLGAESKLTALTGTAESRVETRLLSQSDQSAEAGSLRLVKDASGSTPASDMVVETGASTFLHAPPDNTSGGIVDASLHTVTHPELNVAIAELGQTSTTNLSTTTAAQLPSAFGTSTVTGRFWVNNQADLAQDSLLQLDVSAGRELLRSVSNTSSSTSGTTTSTTSGDRKVQMVATTRVPDFRLFPVKFIPGEQTVRTLIQLQNFVANVDCKSTGSGTATVTASYGGNFSFWRENDQTVEGDNQTKGALITFDLSTAAGRSALNAYGPAGTNPIVYEHPDLLNLSTGHERDIYLFATPGENKLLHTHGATTHQHPAFFTSWKVLEAITPLPPSEGGQLTSAVLADIIQLNSTPLKPDVPQTAINVSIGNLSCEAVDRR